jgi:hypothetical protein
MKRVINTNGVDRTSMYWAYATGQGASAWFSGTTYAQGDIVQTSDNSLWRALSANSGHAPASSPTYWASVDQHGERNVVMRDLYFVGPPNYYAGFEQGTAATDANFGAYPLVDGDLPISYQPYATIPNQGYNPVITFQPFSIQKDKLDYKTGFEASSLQLTLRPRDPNPNTVPGTSLSPYGSRGVPTVSFDESQSYSESLQVPAPYSDSYVHVAGDIALYQTMRQSFAGSQDWFEAPVTMLRTFSPASAPSDVTSYGAAVMFRGRISEFTVDAEDVKITVASLMQIFKQKVPTQTIQLGNRWAPFNFYGTPNYTFTRSGAGTGAWTWVTLTATGDPTLEDGDLAEGWALISNGQGQWWRRIYNNVGSSGATTTLVFLEPLPFNLAGDYSLDIQTWESGQTGNVTDAPGQGFQYVPQPLQGVT